MKPQGNAEDKSADKPETKSESKSEADLEGKVISKKYRIKKLIGSGSFSNVYSGNAIAFSLL